MTNMQNTLFAPTPPAFNHHCPNAMQVHSVKQETHDVWTLELMSADFYSYLPGQYALVSIRNSDSVLRAYTISSSPGLSRFITLTVRRIPHGQGSTWLTQEVKPGDTLWLSDAQGEFTCANLTNNRYLMLAAGCGVTPIISMTRWLLANKPDVDISVFYNIRTREDVLFSYDWLQLAERYPDSLRLKLLTTQEKTDDLLYGRLNNQIIERYVSDLSQRTIMTCGPSSYMDDAEKMCLSMGVPSEQFYKEQFHTATECTLDDAPLAKIRIHKLDKTFSMPVGTTLLHALEQQQVPVIAACRTGVCGSCKTRIMTGDYTTTSSMTLTPDEIAQGYVLACSCQIRGDIDLD